MVRTVAIIPARGGSKGIPGKNIRPVGGVPLIGRTVLAARAAASVDRVFVSTDDPAIAAAAERYGAGVIARPAEISGDTASSESAVLHALRHLEAEDVRPEVIVFLQCTSPFTRGDHIDACVAALQPGSPFSSSFAGIKDHGFLWQHGSEGDAVGVNHDETRPRKRRQELAPTFRETGSVYAMRVEAFLSEGHRFCGRTTVVPIDMPGLEIDEPEDLEIASAVAALPAFRQGLPDLGPVRALVMDFDGVLTDDTVWVSETGTESVRCSRGDGLGLGFLKKAGLDLLILSKEKNPVVSARARKLGIECLQGIDDKLPALAAWAEGRGLTLGDVLYVGNDVNDLECIREAGLSAAPADAHPEVLRAVAHVCTKPGGRGAVREIADLIMAARTN